MNKVFNIVEIDVRYCRDVPAITVYSFDSRERAEKYMKKSYKSIFAAYQKDFGDDYEIENQISLKDEFAEVRIGDMYIRLELHETRINEPRE